MRVFSFLVIMSVIGILMPLRVSAETMSVLPEDYRMELSVHWKGTWLLFAHGSAAKQTDFFIKTREETDIMCSYTPVATPKVRPAALNGIAVVMGTISCNGYDIRDFEWKSSYTDAEYINTSAYLPSHAEFIQKSSRATHLVFEKDTTILVGSIQVVFFPAEHSISAPDPIESLLEDAKTSKETLLDDSSVKAKANHRMQQRQGKLHRISSDDTNNIADPDNQQNRRVDLRRPCTGLKDEEYLTCIARSRTAKRERPALITPHYTAEPRSVSTLRNRLEQPKVSPLADPSGNRISLVPVSRRIAERNKLVQEARRKLNSMKEPQPLARRRANETIRTRMADPLACRRRKGEELIRCLMEQNIEIIKDATVDRETWAIYLERFAPAPVGR